MKKKVAIFAYINNFDPRYSVAGVIKNQVDLLLKQDYDVTLIVRSDWNDILPDGVTLKTIPLYPDTNDRTKYHLYVEELARLLQTYLADQKVCFTHDIFLLEDFISLNQAIRVAIDDGLITHFYNWIHSVPLRNKSYDNPESIYHATQSYCPQSTFIALTRSGIDQLMARYELLEHQVRVVHNFIEPMEALGISDEVATFYEKYQWYNQEIRIIYPCRAAHGKQVEKLIKLIGALAQHTTVGCVIALSYDGGVQEKELIASYQELINFLGLEDSVILTSDNPDLFGYTAGIGIERKYVYELLRIANLFIFPSISESFGQVVLEAIYNNCVIVLNNDSLQLSEFLGQITNGIQYQYGLGLSFGSLTRPITGYAPSEDAWYEDSACKILDYMRQTPHVNGRNHMLRKYNPQWVWANQYLGLLNDRD